MDTYFSVRPYSVTPPNMDKILKFQAFCENFIVPEHYSNAMSGSRSILERVLMQNFVLYKSHAGKWKMLQLYLFWGRFFIYENSSRHAEISHTVNIFVYVSKTYTVCTICIKTAHCLCTYVSKTWLYIFWHNLLYLDTSEIWTLWSGPRGVQISEVLL